MNLGQHASFIVAAYVIAIAVVGALVIWVIADSRTQKRMLADLESRGARRAGEREP